MSTYKRGNKWWIRFRFNHQRYFKCSPDNSRAGAMAYEAVLRQKLAHGEPIIEVRKKQQTPLFLDFVDKWLKTYVATNNKPSEQTQKTCMVRKHLKPYFGKIPLNKITSLQIEEFKAKKQVDGLCNKSVNNLLGIIGKCLRTAQEWEIIDKIPKIKSLKVAPQAVNYLNEKEYNLLLESIDQKSQFYEMLLFTLRTGVRIGELLALDWSDINYANKSITIKRNVVNGIVGSPKNNKFRTIYLAQDIFQMLSIRKRASGLVFPGENGTYYSRFSCRRSLEKFCHKANVKRIGWHGLRHSFASQLATNGVSLKTIQELLGHSDLKMVQRYAHLEPITLREAIQTLEPKNSFNLNIGYNTETIPEIVLEQNKKQVS